MKYLVQLIEERLYRVWYIVDGDENASDEELFEKAKAAGAENAAVATFIDVLHATLSEDEDRIEEAPTSIPLVAGGYEWTCLICHHLNTLPDVPIRPFTCAHCGYEFTDGEAHHAYE